MINRRKFLEITAGAGASLAITPQLLRGLQRSDENLIQQPGGTVIQRVIPSTGEMLPVIGLGFANHPSCADPAALKAVLETFVDNGGKVFDTQQGNASDSEGFHAKVANELGIQNKLFFCVKGYRTGVSPQTPNADAAKAQIESLFAMFKVSTLDLVELPGNSDPTYWDVLKGAKKAGRIRYIGAGVGPMRQEESLSIMRNEPIDFIRVDYNLDRRAAAEAILPLAQERKIAVLATRIFGGANGSSCTGGKGLFGRVGNTPVPAWASEFDAKTWGQFFLKYVISHPAITVARVGTTKPHHMLDNIAGCTGRLPNEATRRRMEQFLDGTPGAAVPPPAVVAPAILDRYVGEYKTAAGTILTFRRQGAQLLVKEGNDPSAALWPHSETRFGQGPVFEFQLDGAGTVTGLTMEYGNPVQRVPASRIR